MTNELILGPDHEDLVSFEHSAEINHEIVIMSLVIVTLALILILITYKIAIRYKRKYYSNKIKELNKMH